jgi:hypothetical protein
MKKNLKLFPFYRFIMLDFPGNLLTRSSSTYVKMPEGYMSLDSPKNVNYFVSFNNLGIFDQYGIYWIARFPTRNNGEFF